MPPAATRCLSKGQRQARHPAQARRGPADLAQGRPARRHEARSPRALARAPDGAVKQLQTKQVDLVVLDQGIDTSTAVGRMFFQILGAIAEFEHALMSERTRDGLDAARARGRTGGQKPKLTPRQAKIAQEMYDELGADGRRVHTARRIADEFGVTRPTIYRHLQRQTD